MVAGREESGNAFLSGRELAIEDALASKAHIDALAVALRHGGLPGTLQRLRVLAFNDLTQGRDPLTGSPAPARPARPGSDGQHGSAASPAATPDAANGSSGDRRDQSPLPGNEPGRNAGTAATARQAATTALTPATAMMMPAGTAAPTCPNGSTNAAAPPKTTTTTTDPGAPPGPPAPFPALINLTVPAGTAYGWSSAPGEAGGWGLTDPDDTRRLLQAASMHPRTRWCVTLLAPDGTAVAHGCARGQHPWIPPPDSGSETATAPTPGRPPRSPTPARH